MGSPTGCLVNWFHSQGVVNPLDDKTHQLKKMPYVHETIGWVSAGIYGYEIWTYGPKKRYQNLPKESVKGIWGRHCRCFSLWLYLVLEMPGTIMAH